MMIRQVSQQYCSDDVYYMLSCTNDLLALAIGVVSSCRAAPANSSPADYKNNLQ